MKRTLSVLLLICVAVGVFVSCGRSDTPPQITEKTSVTQNVTIAETTSEEMTTEQTDVEETQNVPMMEETALEPAPEEWEAWQKKALDVMQSATIQYAPELAFCTFMLQDLSQDGIPEIIEMRAYIEDESAPETIWMWHNGNYTRVYSAQEDYNVRSITAYRNKQTGQIELWDLGNIDYQLEDYYPDDPLDWSSAVFPPIGSINENINQLKFKDGKLIIAERHDELKSFATPDMTDEQVKRAWKALHDFSTAFWKTHDRAPIEIYSKSIDFLRFDWHFDSLAEDNSILLSKSDLPQEQYRTADYYSNLEPQHETESYRYNRNHLRAIIEDY